MQATENKIVDFDITLMCRFLASSLGAEVVEDPSAKTFSTNGKRVVIPSNIAGGELTAKIMRFGLAHEAAGHMVHTNFVALNAWPLRANPVAFGFFNIIEDPRIEKCAQDDYPGARKINREGVEELERRGFFVLPTQDAHPASILSSWLIRHLRVDMLKQPLALDKIDVLAKSVFDLATLDRILAVAKKGAAGKKTEDAIAAAEAILSILKEASEPPKEQPSNDQGGDQGDDDQSVGDSGSSGQQTSDAAGAPQGNGGPEGDQDGDGQQETPGQSKADAAKAVLGAGKPEMGKTDISEVIGEAIEDDQGKNPSSGRGRHSGVVARRDHRRAAHYNPSVLATNLTAKLRSRMQEMLMSRVEDEDDELSDRGRLSMRCLTRGVVGDKNIFSVDGAEGEGISTAVHLLVDSSGSMSDHGKAGAASSIIYALSSAIAAYEMQGAKFAISSFDDHVQDLKGFDDRWVKAKNWVGNYRPNGTTMMSQAMRTIFSGLAIRKERRKVLFVITDGDVGEQEINARINSTAKSTGVEIHVLAIGGKAPPASHGFVSAVSVPVSDQALIQKAIFGLLSRFIR